MKTFLTPDDLMARWNCSKGYIYLLSARRVLRKVKLGHLIRFKIEDVEAYERLNTVEARGESSKSE